MMIAFVIWSICAAGFAALSIYSQHSTKAVSVWANVAAPKVKDVRAYNRAVSRVWLVFAVLFELPGLLLLFAGQNSPLALLIIPMVMLLVIGAMIAFNRIDREYRE